tara:strand:+ start:27 stop:515 length:489 start_codon:yes stop_codon:yes gene_type:complete
MPKKPIQVTDPDGKVYKYSYAEYKKFYQERRDKELKEEIIKALKKNFDKLEGDGHGVFKVYEYIVDIGLPEEFVVPFARKHYSDFSDYKNTLTDSNGSIMDYCWGINNLDILYALCDIVGWDKQQKDLDARLYGRGGRARVCKANLALKLNILSKKEALKII